MPLALTLLKFPLNEIANDRADFNDHYDIRIDALRDCLKSLLLLIDAGGVPPGIGPVKDAVANVFATPVAGEVAYVSGDDTIDRAKADSLLTLRAAGAFASTGVMHVGGVFPLLFEPSLTPLAGEIVYLSETTAGRATNVQPSTSGNYIVILGILKDATGYDNINGSAMPVVWQTSLPILIP